MYLVNIIRPISNFSFIITKSNVRKRIRCASNTRFLIPFCKWHALSGNITDKGSIEKQKKKKKNQRYFLSIS